MSNYELPTTNYSRQRYVVLNGLLLDAGEVRISPLGDGFMFGLGVFETIKVLNGRPVLFSDHF